MGYTQIVTELAPKIPIPPSANYAPTESAFDAIKRVRYWHMYVMDLMIAHPQLKQGDIAAMIGRSEAWISRVVNSDMFQEVMAYRRMEQNQDIRTGIMEKLESLADIALDQMVERVTTRGNELPMSTLKETADMALNRLGYGTQGQAKGVPAVQVNIHQATPSGLEEARARLRAATTIDMRAADEHASQVPALQELPPGWDGFPSEAGEIRASLDTAEYAESREVSGVEI